MKKIFTTLTAICLLFGAYAQKKSKQDTAKNEIAVVQKKFTCDSIVVDFESGLLNKKIGPGSPIDSVKKYLPCVTEEIPEKSQDHYCGGGAVLGNKGIFISTEHGYIQFSVSTSAQLPLPVLGIPEDSLTRQTGEPVQIFDLQPYSDRAVQSVYLFPKNYGCLAIWVDKKDNTVFKVQLHNQPPGKAYLCVE